MAVAWNKENRMTTTQEKLAFIAIAICVLIAGWMDGQDAKLMETDKDALTVACIHCGER